MSTARTRRRTQPSLPKVPRLVELARHSPGTYRLNWVGSLSPAPAPAPFSYRVDAQFVEAGSREPRVITVPLPIGCLPYLTATTLWKDGSLVGFHPAANGEFHVDMEGFDTTRHRARNPYDLLPPWVYPLHSMPGHSWCRVYPTREGPELIVPHWEIIRNW